MMAPVYFSISSNFAAAKTGMKGTNKDESDHVSFGSSISSKAGAKVADGAIDTRRCGG